MKYRVWYSTESLADYIIEKTELKTKNCTKSKMYESDANNSKKFHTLPDHIKKILYLDAPDLIVEVDSEPIFSMEISTEAGTGHNVFQRFARLAASVENNVPAFYIYPEATIVERQNIDPKWDKINPLIFKALDEVMNIYGIPALLYYFPSTYSANNPAKSSTNKSTKGLIFDNERIKFAGCPDSNATEMKSLFAAINEIIAVVENCGVITARTKFLQKIVIRDRKNFMQQKFVVADNQYKMSPLSATEIIETESLLNHLADYENSDYKIGKLLKSRKQTIVYKINSKFRGDPYPGALAAIDYLLCREGKTFEERKYNLVLAWGDFTYYQKTNNFSLTSTKCSINDFVSAVKASESKNILTKNYDELKSDEIPRYYMQVRFGSMYSKVKHIRVYAYFADAILFPDGALWRDG